jgi:hypothetical protein
MSLKIPQRELDAIFEQCKTAVEARLKEIGESPILTSDELLSVRKYSLVLKFSSERTTRAICRERFWAEKDGLSR